jgi:transposase
LSVPNDSDPLDRDIAERYGIEDGRHLRRYRKRWRVQRPFAWLHHFGRLMIRSEYRVENFYGMVRLGCMQILFRCL